MCFFLSRVPAHDDHVITPVKYTVHGTESDAIAVAYETLEDQTTMDDGKRQSNEDNEGKSINFIESIGH